MSEYGLVESILASVQWDRWRFNLSAKKLCKQDVAVISHSHEDAWRARLAEKDLVIVPRGLRVPQRFHSLRNILEVDYSTRVDRLALTPVYRSTVARVTELRIPKRLHSVWWHAAGKTKSAEANVIFVGDMDLPEGEYLLTFIGRLLEINRPVQGIILPSYGGVVNAHGAGTLPLQLAQEVERTAVELHDLYGLRLFGVPHPISEAPWAERNAVEL